MLNLLCRLGQCLLRLRYRVCLEGLAPVAARGARGILFLANHPALIDPVILVTALHPRFRPRVLADRDRVNIPGARWLLDRLGVIPMPDPGRQGAASQAELEAITRDCAAALRRGENLLFWPAGRIALSRREDLGGNSLVETLLRACPDIRVVLIRTRGLWGSSFGRAPASAPRLDRVLLRGLGALLANGLFFTPRRPVTIALAEPADLPRGRDRATLNRYLEDFFNRDAPPAVSVSYFFWQRRAPRILPEPVALRTAAGDTEASDATRAIVREHLRKISGADEIPETADLARDLSLDSLARAELGAWLEREFGLAAVGPDALRTVGDVLLAAQGLPTGGEPIAVKPPPATWFTRPRSAPPLVPEGHNLLEVFLAQARRGPGRPALADQQGGVWSYRRLLTVICALRPALSRMEGQHLGLMLPASAAAAAAYLAALSAGKTPVMINWTAGLGTLTTALDRLGVCRIVTARALAGRLASQGVDLRPVAGRLVLLEDLGRRLTPTARLAAWLTARCRPRSLRRTPPPATAVVLFTSGSESAPKTVPLSHANLLANIRDLAACYRFQPADRALGMLPPFHSFGLTCGLLFPLCAGVRTALHPDPTDGARLAGIIASYGVSLLMSAPSFLRGIFRAAADRQLASLRLAVTGAEKCPDELRAEAARRWPRLALLEGYGITECSPVIAANREEEPRPGSIGRVLPSLAFAVRDLDGGGRAPPGRPGLLLVRGPSVFSGYLHYEGPPPFEEFEGHTWYRTGDLVSADETGVLTFAGRLKRFVKLGGEMISLPAIEEALLRVLPPGADPAHGPVLAVEAAPAALNPDLVLFTTLDLGRQETNQAIRQAGLSPLHNIRRVERLDALPVLGTGKTDYRALRARLLPPALPGAADPAAASHP